MSDSQALLAHVVAKFAPRQWENIATESLHFLLNRPHAEHAMLALLADLGLVADSLSWSTQAASNDDVGIPDLVGDDREGRPTVIVEAKFWAALTSNQPSTYLDRQARMFPDDRECHVLLFLVPQRRLRLLAAEVGSRLGSAPVEQGHYLEVPDPRGRVVVVSWLQLLARLQLGLEAARDTTGLNDLAQLRGLCDQADQEAMLPIAREEIDAGIGHRFYEFCELANGAADALINDGAADAKGLRSAAGQGWYCRYLRASSGHVFGLGVYAWSWGNTYPSPWWVKFWDPSTQVEEAVASLAGHSLLPYYGKRDKRVEVALRAPVELEQAETIAQLCAAVRAICDRLPQVESAVVSETSGPLDQVSVG